MGIISWLKGNRRGANDVDIASPAHKADPFLFYARLRALDRGFPRHPTDRWGVGPCLPRREDPGCVRGIDAQARIDGARRLCAGTSASTGRGGRFPSHVPRAGPEGRIGFIPQRSWQLVARRRTSNGSLGAIDHYEAPKARAGRPQIAHGRSVHDAEGFNPRGQRGGFYS